MVMIKKLINKIIRTHANILINSEYDLQIQLRKKATQESLQYIQKNMKDAIVFLTLEQLFERLLPEIPSGLVLEFGVWKGKDITFIANHLPTKTIYGFDSFYGLPDHWTGWYGYKKHFNLNGVQPKVPKNVQLIKGNFSNTIKPFLKRQNHEIAFVHIDCNIYESAKTVLDNIGNRIKKDTIIIFDEYFNYPNWQQHEFRAFQEFTNKHSVNYDYIGFTPQSEVAIKIL